MKALHRIAFALAVLCAGPASALTLDVTSRQPGESVEVAGLGAVETAELGGILDGSRGWSYAVAPAQPLGDGASAGWTLAALDSDARLRAAWLVDTFHPEIYGLVEGGVPRATAVAALQVAVWEVVADGIGGDSLDSGAFALAGASPGVRGLANGFLGALDQADLAGFSSGAVWISRDCAESQLFFGYGGAPQPIPEPGAFGLCGAGLLLAAWAFRRRRASA